MTIPPDTEKIYGELSRLREEIERLRDQISQLDQSNRRSIRTEHPHVVRIEGVHGGRPTIRGTGVSVQTIVEQSQLGRSSQQVVEDFDGVLTVAQVYDALSYYHEHKGELDQAIKRNREAVWTEPQTATSS